MATKPEKNPNANRKAKTKLAIRLKDWAETMNRPENRGKDMSGYHKPGSMQR